jgi:hypothetical protein
MRHSMDCPGPANLLLVAVDPKADQVRESVARHVRTCASCRQTLELLRQTVGALRDSACADGDVVGPCLAESAIAEIVDGGARAMGPEIAAHVAACPACRQQVASLAQLLCDAAIREEIARLEHKAPVLRLRSRRVTQFAVLSGLLAAGLAAVLLWPAIAADRSGQRAESGDVVQRERTVMTTVAPRLISPRGSVVPGDSLRWTAVPHADRYRVTVFDREGATVWEEETGDTLLALPTTLAHGIPYLWKVEARIGFGRWAASEDLVTFTLRAR